MSVNDTIEEDVHPEIQVALDVIEQQLTKVNKVLKKVEPLIARRDKLMAARRVLLSTNSTTGGAGSPRTRLSMDEVVSVFRSNKKKTRYTVAQLAEQLSVTPSTVRSHLNRNRDTRYEQLEDGRWKLTETDDE